MCLGPADENRDKFEMEVFGPLFLEIEVETELDGKMVETALGQGYMFRFLVQSDKDYDT